MPKQVLTGSAGTTHDGPLAAPENIQRQAFFIYFTPIKCYYVYNALHSEPAGALSARGNGNSEHATNRRRERPADCE